MDLNKRRTLKLISGVGAAAMCSVTASAATAMPGTVDGKPVRNTGENTSYGAFNIQIISGRATPEDTVIFTNHSGADIQIRSFLPGLVTQNDQMIDLNSLLANGELNLKHGYPFATKAATWQPLSLDSEHGYLWCDTAVSRLPNSDTGIITLDAVVNNGRALLTAKHEEISLS